MKRLGSHFLSSATIDEYGGTLLDAVSDASPGQQLGHDLVRSLVGLGRELFPRSSCVLVSAKCQLESVADEKPQQGDFLVYQPFIFSEGMAFA